jgi:tellurite resistance-related uncharacterized protein
MLNVELHGDGLDDYGDDEDTKKKEFDLICDRQDECGDELDLPDGFDDGFSNPKAKWTHLSVKHGSVTVRFNAMQHKMVTQANVEFHAVHQNAVRVS